MGRPPNTDPAVTRNRILQAAIDLFGENGREGAAIREVARRAEVSMSTVLHHFGSKQGLFDACVESMFERLAEHTDSMFELARTRGTARDMADTVVRSCFRFARQHTRLLRVITCEAVTSGHMPDDVRDRLVLPTLARAADAVAEVAGRAPLDARMAVLSICHIVTRFVLMNATELAADLGLTVDGDEDRLYQVVEDQVVRNAELMLWGVLP